MPYMSDTVGVARIRRGRRAGAVSAVLGIATITLGVAAVDLAAAAGSIPGTDPLRAAGAWTLLFCAASVWLGWLTWSMVNAHWRPRWRVPVLAVLAILPLLLAGGFGIAAFTDASLRQRFTGSEPAMSAYAEHLMAGRRPPLFPQNSPLELSCMPCPGPVPLQLGTYRFTTVNSSGGYIEFLVDGTIGITGFVYNPKHYGLVPNDPSDTYRHLTGPWYVMDKPNQ